VRNRKVARALTLRLLVIAMDDPIIQRIERFPCSRGPCARNAATVAIRFTAPGPAHWWHACARPDVTRGSKYSIGRSGRTSTGPFGRTILSIDDALRFIACKDSYDLTVKPTKLLKVELRTVSSDPSAMLVTR
jgi:hypothetical protein